jgi:hypothetical protein
MRIGLVSQGAISRVAPGYRGNWPRESNAGDTGTGPVGLIGSDHIDAAAQQRAGKGFSNAEADSNPDTGPGAIDARRNARQYGPRARGKDPFRKSSWRPEWFNRNPMGKLGDRSSDPAVDVGGPDGMGWGATGTSARDRAMRGE